MAMAQELAWDFHCVPRKCATNVLVATRELFLCTHLQRTWEESNGWTPQEIKLTSNMGQARMDKRGRDAGNYFYAVVWELMDLMTNADDERELTATPAFRDLQSRFQCLAPDIDQLSQHAIVVRGDMLEIAIYMARLTGPAVDADLRRERHQFNDLMRALIRSWDNLQSRLCPDYVPVRFRPCPRLTAHAIFTLS